MKTVRKLFGGLKMTWPLVVILALCSGLLTGAIAAMPFFLHSSVHNIAECFEAWFFLALIVIFNCGKPLEAGVKTFVFFLISQPLVYLVQAPFNSMGFGLFRYYIPWLVWTVLTFPGGMIAWYAKKGNWLSVPIISAANLFLSLEFSLHFEYLVGHFPRQLFACAFIIAEIAVFTLAIPFDKKKRAVVWGIALAALIVFTALLTDVFKRKAEYTTELDKEGYIVSSFNENLETEIDGTTLKVRTVGDGDYRIMIMDEEGVEKMLVLEIRNGKAVFHSDY